MPEFEARSPDKANGVQAEDAADARESRIAELREKCSDGTYRVDAAKVSAKIVGRHLDKTRSNLLL